MNKYSWIFIFIHEYWIFTCSWISKLQHTLTCLEGSLPYFHPRWTSWIFTQMSFLDFRPLLTWTPKMPSLLLKPSHSYFLFPGRKATTPTLLIPATLPPVTIPVWPGSQKAKEKEKKGALVQEHQLTIEERSCSQKCGKVLPCYWIHSSLHNLRFRSPNKGCGWLTHEELDVWTCWLLLGSKHQPNQELVTQI